MPHLTLGNDEPALPSRLAPSTAAELAFAAWSRHAAAVAARREVTKHREERIDLDRRLAVLERQQQACLDALGRARAAEGVTGPAVLVAHRDRRTAEQLAEAVRARAGNGHVEVLDNGADAVGVALALQPGLVVVDAPLPMMTALDVVRDLHRYSPASRVAACATGCPPDLLAQAGAAAVYRRGASADDVAAMLVATGQVAAG